jgi:hypothetical protein
VRKENLEIFLSDYTRISRAQKQYTCEHCNGTIAEGTFYINTADLRWGVSSKSGRKFVAASTKGAFHIGCRIKNLGDCKLCGIPVFKSFDHHPMENYVLHTECYDLVFVGGNAWKLAEEIKEKYVTEASESRNLVELARSHILKRPDYKKLVEVGFLRVIAAQPARAEERASATSGTIAAATRVT